MTERSAPVTVTENAFKRIKFLIDRENMEGSKLRVSVEGGGCSGFQYSFSFDKNQDPDDIAIEKDGITVLIDPSSLLYVIGAQIDFYEDIVGSAFKISNPNAQASCGCGSSFAV
ncbi:MAG: iron-sulfur cluster insertion protein ErpA [Sphingomonadales bacterium]